MYTERNVRTKIPEKIVRKVEKLAARRCDCWLIGSRARGDYEPDSDWDINCICKDPPTDRYYDKIDGNKVAVRFFDINKVSDMTKVVIFGEGVKIVDNLGIEYRLNRDEVVRACISESRKIVSKMSDWLARHSDEFPFKPDLNFGALDYWRNNLVSVNKTCRLALGKVKNGDRTLFIK